MSAVQRVLSSAASGRVHGFGHEAAFGPHIVVPAETTAIEIGTGKSGNFGRLRPEPKARTRIQTVFLCNSVDAIEDLEEWLLASNV